MHLSRPAEGAQRWLAQKSGLEPVVQEALPAEETRQHVSVPERDRCAAVGQAEALRP